MRTYTEQEVMKAAKYAKGMQKAEDYQMTLNIIGDDTITQVEADEQIGNFLYNDTFVSITIQDINEYLNGE